MKRSNLAYNSLNILLVTLSMLASPLVLGEEVCSFEGQYVWSEKGKNFVDTSFPPDGLVDEVVELVEVGNFTAIIHSLIAKESNDVFTGTIIGESTAVFKLPFSTWVHVKLKYSNGEFTFNNSDCTGEGFWECEATLKSSVTPPPPNAPPVPISALVEGLCEVPLSFSLVTSEGGKKLNFIITGGTQRIVSSGSATRVRRARMARDF